MSFIPSLTKELTVLLDLQLIDFSRSQSRPLLEQFPNPLRLGSKVCVVLRKLVKNLEVDSCSWSFERTGECFSAFEQIGPLGY